MLCQFSGAGENLKKYLSIPGIYPAGRLDRDSEGLVLLTDDGKLQHRLTEPRFGHARTYWVQVEGVPDDAALRRLASGVTVQGYRTRPAEVRRLHNEAEALPLRDPPIRFRKTVPTSWIEIKLSEGRNRQVRRMTAAVGYPTLRLIRVGIGELRLEGLQPGQWRELSTSEVRSLAAPRYDKEKSRG